MGKRHSSNANAKAVYTYDERQKLKIYGNQTKRLGRDSMRDYDACSLCFATARNPVICSQGHLFCKECIVKNILSQKKEIDASKALLLAKKEQADVKSKADKERIELEKMEMFMKLEGQTPVTEHREKQEIPKNIETFWIKRPYDSKNESTPEISKIHPVCTAGKKQHNIALKKLIEVKFTTKESSNFCNACTKAFKNGTSIVILKGCGHVCCKECISKFTKCVNCEFPIKNKDAISLVTDGTGFSEIGNNVATKQDLAFQ